MTGGGVEVRLEEDSGAINVHGDVGDGAQVHELRQALVVALKEETQRIMFEFVIMSACENDSCNTVYGIY